MASNGHSGTNRIPKIGIPCARDKSQRYYGLPIFIQNTTYLRAITDGGAAPIIIPLQLDEATLRVIYETVDGIFLPGGEDMDPAQYDEQHHEMLGATDPERDRTEMLLGRWALEDSKPLMAICRGAQVLNVIQGGSLYQDIRALRAELGAPRLLPAPVRAGAHQP
ncbi:MAG: gamma-glutamyl-gamma-aminobutyrate hydrolase family protein [Anaerolineae bacterium]